MKRQKPWLEPRAAYRVCWRDDERMPTSPQLKTDGPPAANAWPPWLAEAGGAALLAALLACFLAVSWRKWPEPYY